MITRSPGARALHCYFFELNSSATNHMRAFRTYQYHKMGLRMKAKKEDPAWRPVVGRLDRTLKHPEGLEAGRPLVPHK